MGHTQQTVPLLLAYWLLVPTLALLLYPLHANIVTVWKTNATMMTVTSYSITVPLHSVYWLLVQIQVSCLELVRNTHIPYMIMHSFIYVTDITTDLRSHPYPIW